MGPQGNPLQNEKHFGFGTLFFGGAHFTDEKREIGKYLGLFGLGWGPWPMVSTVVQLALYLGAPLALERDPAKALNLERLLAPCSIGS